MKKNNKKILIIEDDDNFLFILGKMFTAEGFTVVTAKDGEAGIDAAATEKPDLILSDVLMPRMDGPTMAKKLEEAKIKTPVVFLTNVENRDKEHDYLLKSKLHLDEIVQKIKEKLGV